MSATAASLAAPAPEAGGKHMTVEFRVTLPAEIPALVRLSRDVEGVIGRSGLTCSPVWVRGELSATPYEDFSLADPSPAVCGQCGTESAEAMTTVDEFTAWAGGHLPVCPGWGPDARDEEAI